MTDDVRLIGGDCLDVLRAWPDACVDAVVTDPPYGLAFMGKRWDIDVPGVDIWRECLRVLKPDGHLLAFAGTRTQHRMATRIEEAGFEVRDLIAWVYGSGFPKSLDVSKAIDKGAGVEGRYGEPKSAAHAGWIDRGRMRGEEGHEGYQRPWMADADAVDKNARQYIGSTDAARQWAGWGTALKPALEPITLARKPLDGTVAANVLTHGTGTINVDGCRVGADEGRPLIENRSDAALNAFGNGLNGSRHAGTTTRGRWPANLIHDGSDEPTDLLGEAARFFYTAKASRSDRDDGCDALPFRTAAETVERTPDSAGMDSPRAGAGRTAGARNHHPTVKPTDLMRYLCRLVTPPGGLILDPFMGSGSTGRGARLEGFRFVGIERDPEYLAIAEARVAAVRPETSPGAQPTLFDALMESA